MTQKNSVMHLQFGTLTEVSYLLLLRRAQGVVISAPVKTTDSMEGRRR